MKKIIVVSDSHKHNQVLNQIFKAHPDIDTCIHCGDLQDRLDNLMIKNLYIVNGNTDFTNLDKELVIKKEDSSIYVCHGHQYQVDGDLSSLKAYVSNHHYQIVCFGHTHQAQYFFEDGIYYLNPGSVCFPRGGKYLVSTYAILTIDKTTVACDFYNAKTNELMTDEKPLKKKSSFFNFFRK